MAITDLLKTELYSSQSICTRSTIFAHYISEFAARYNDLAAVLQHADDVFDYATNKRESSVVPNELRGLDDPYARQTLSDFESRLYHLAQRSKDFRDTYNSQRSSMILRPAFDDLLPDLYEPVAVSCASEAEPAIARPVTTVTVPQKQDTAFAA